MSRDILTICKVLCIWGSNDHFYKKSYKSYQRLSKKNQNIFLDTQIVEDADHNFFSWNYKKDAIGIIINWLKDE